MVRVYHDIKRVWLFHGTHIKCVGQDYHEISVKELSNGMEKRRFWEITMRKGREIRYQGTDFKENFNNAMK